MRVPQSVRWFERLYYAGLATSLLLLGMDEEFLPALDLGWQNPAFIVTVITMLIAVTISLLLWHFVVRHRSNVAKWLVAVLAVLSVVSFAVPGDEKASTVAGWLDYVEVALTVSAAICLFLPDARRWLRKEQDDLRETFS